MRVLLVGGSGFVGGHLRALCHQRGDEVFATHRPQEQVGEEPGLVWKSLELLEDGALPCLLAEVKPQGIVHLAGQANVALANKDPVTTFRINAEGTLRLLDATRREAPLAHVVAVISAEVYGPVTDDEPPVAEERPMTPRTPYGASKAAADVLAAQAAEGWGLSVVRMRPFNHIGRGQRLGFVAPDFAAQIAAIERGLLPPLLRVGNLAAERDFTDVRDVVRAYRGALDGDCPRTVYNLCSGRAVSIRQIVDFFVSQSTVDIEVVIDSERMQPIDVPKFLGDATRAAEDLDWRAEIPLEESLIEVLEEWRTAPDDLLPAAR